MVLALWQICVYHYVSHKHQGTVVAVGGGRAAFNYFAQLYTVECTVRSVCANNSQTLFRCKMSQDKQIGKHCCNL